ncbi:MAG TPA: DUF4271 domain-containing protein [Bacteroidia bacterium]|jgi:hypothetical protein|nr:DUF4271 domain-containing protein [Bacteroidia bacterium]
MPDFIHPTDSLLPGNTLPIPGLFTSHSLPVKHSGEAETRVKNYDSYFFLILFCAFVFFVLVKVFSRRKLQQLFLAFIKPSAMNQLLREEYAFTDRSTILLLALSWLIIPLFIFQAITHFHPLYLETSGMKLYGQGLLAFAGMYLVKIISIRLLSLTTGFKSEGSEYIYTILLFNKVAGLIMFPLVLLVAFARQLNPIHLLYMGIGILSILLAYRLLRLIQSGLTTGGVSVLYLFLYLCTLEILPFVVIIKLFMIRFS